MSFAQGGALAFSVALRFSNQRKCLTQKFKQPRKSFTMNRAETTVVSPKNDCNKPRNPFLQVIPSRHAIQLRSNSSKNLHFLSSSPVPRCPLAIHCFPQLRRLRRPCRRSPRRSPRRAARRSGGHEEPGLGGDAVELARPQVANHQDALMKT